MLPSDISANQALAHLSRHDHTPMGITRRRFLQAIAAGAGTALATSLLPDSMASALTAVGPHDGILLLVYLHGGVDGLNVVVPFGQGTYYDLRPDIAIAGPSTLPLASGLGLHPRLTFMKSQFDAGKLAIVQGVGVPDPDYSHFTMTARWMNGSVGTPATPTTGWIGRWMDGLAQPDLLQAVHLGWGGTPLHLIGSQRSAVALNSSNGGYGSDTSAWIQDSYQALREMSVKSAASGTWARSFADTMRDQLAVANAVSPAYVGAPSTSARQFAVAAGLINANVGIRVVSVGIGSFDSHSGEPAQLDSLLGELNDGLQLFWSSLAPSFQNRTTAMTFSEFGRRAIGNKSVGTDHGAAGPLFVMGPRVRGGLHGSHPSLTNLIDSKQLASSVDFRVVYQQMIDQWLGGDSRQLLGATYSGLNLFTAAPGDIAPPPPPPPPVVVHSGAAYRPIVPERMLDTRSGLGAPSGKVGPASAIDVTIGGLGPVPPTGVTAVLMNVTATGTTAPGFLTVWPTGATKPEASNLNFDTGQTVPNLVLAKLGSAGKVSIFNAAGYTHVLADVCGYFVDDSGSGLVPLTPWRALDTRSAAEGPLRPAGTTTLKLTSIGGIPASGVEAVVINVTAVSPTAAGFLTVWPSGEATPATSNLNFVAGKTVPNLVVSKVGSDGAICIYNDSGTTNVLVDVVGYYATTGGTGTVPVTPERLMDTRTTSRIGPGATIDLRVAGLGPVPATGARSVTLNVTAVSPSEAGYLTAFPTGSKQPTASSLNFAAGQTVANLVVAKVGDNGSVSFFNSSGSTNLIVDVVGYTVD
jgi:uncharacterized protein (DUF1501 family)